MTGNEERGEINGSVLRTEDCGMFGCLKLAKIQKPLCVGERNQ